MIAAGAATQLLQRVFAARFHRKPARRPALKPIISFTFDDFPRSAAAIAGRMLSDYGARGTFYAALGLMGTRTVVGDMFERSDLVALVSAGHELACHTFDHVLCSKVTRPELLANCQNNRMRIAEVLDGYSFENFSFPEGVVTASAKYALSSVYKTCRTIESGINRDPVDLGFLRANRVYSRPGIGKVKELIQQNKREDGWTILYTHDVCETPSPYGCTPAEFREVLDCAVRSGAEILSVAEARRRFTVSDRIS
jgi:peptidoglycan/xylan/chitin deacetylase (PgdA/CDA1 family)